MKHRNPTPTLSQLSAALFLAAVTTLSAACDEAVADEPDPLAAEVTELSSRLQDLEDIDAIERAMDCYGYGHDMIFFDLQGDHGEALAILRDCFTEDVKTDVYFFDGAEPMARLNNLEELVGFVAGFAMESHYVGARNVPGNHQVELLGVDRARMLSSTSAPHYVQAPGTPEEPGHVDLVSARYENELSLGEDGRWRTTRFVLRIEGFWRGTGVYPFGR